MKTSSCLLLIGTPYSSQPCTVFETVVERNMPLAVTRSIAIPSLLKGKAFFYNQTLHKLCISTEEYVLLCDAEYNPIMKIQFGLPHTHNPHFLPDLVLLDEDVLVMQTSCCKQRFQDRLDEQLELLLLDCESITHFSRLLFGCTLHLNGYKWFYTRRSTRLARPLNTPASNAQAPSTQVALGGGAGVGGGPSPAGALQRTSSALTIGACSRLLPASRPNHISDPFDVSGINFESTRLIYRPSDGHRPPQILIFAPFIPVPPLS